MNRPFTQEDPIGIAGGLNLYGYAGGDPINYADPFGLNECDDIEDDAERATCEEKKAQEEATDQQGEGNQDNSVCAAAWGVFGVSFAGDVAFATGVGLGIKAITSGSALLASAGANAAYGAALLEEGGATAVTLGWSTKAVAVGQGIAGITSRRAGAHLIVGSFAASVDSDVGLNLAAEANGLHVSGWDFVPFVSTVRAFRNAQRVCRQ